MRRFAQHMQAEDERYEVPPAHAFGRAPRQPRMPHISTPDDIRLLRHAAAQLTPIGSMRPTTSVTLFALIASTGLRISEALARQLDHLTPAGLRIEQTKFRKSRLVPLPPTAQQGLPRYVVRRRQVGGTCRSLFVSLWETRLTYSTVYPVFLELMRSIGWRGAPGSPGPCMHDLRHTCAVRALEQCTGSEAAIRRQVLALATSLGPAQPSATSYYLQATPKLLEGIARAGERLFQEGGQL